MNYYPRTQGSCFSCGRFFSMPAESLIIFCQRCSELRKLSPPKLTFTTAATVVEEYKTNEVRAKETYLHKRVRVVGLVNKVVTSGKQVHVILGVDLGRNVTMKFTGTTTDLANLSKDDRVVIDGTGDGTVLGNPLFKDCTLLGSGYATIDEAFAKAKEID